jgi:hypothetical protein
MVARPRRERRFTDLQRRPKTKAPNHDFGLAIAREIFFHGPKV